jgi:nucleotide-binding universal stress UspA family protein
MPETDFSIVVGTDGSRTASAAVERAGALAKPLRAVVHLVCAFRPAGGKSWALEGQTYDMARADALEILEQGANDLRTAGIAVETHAAHGDPAEVLLEVVESIQAHLLVVGSKGMSGAKRYLLGSVPNKVSHYAPCNVLIVRTK